MIILLIWLSWILEGQKNIMIEMSTHKYLNQFYEYIALIWANLEQDRNTARLPDD